MVLAPRLNGSAEKTKSIVFNSENLNPPPVLRGWRCGRLCIPRGREDQNLFVSDQSLPKLKVCELQVGGKVLRPRDPAFEDWEVA